MLIPFLLKTHERILVRLPEVTKRLKAEGEHELAEDLAIATDILKTIDHQRRSSSISEADIVGILNLAEAFAPMAEEDNESLADANEILSDPGMQAFAVKIGLRLTLTDQMDAHLANQIRRIILISVLSLASRRLVELEPDSQSAAVRAEKLQTELDSHCRLFNSLDCRVPPPEMISTVYAGIKEASRLLLHAGDMQESRICSAFTDYFKEWITAREIASRIRNSE